jgi:hypothetical protein
VSLQTKPGPRTVSTSTEALEAFLEFKMADIGARLRTAGRLAEQRNVAQEMLNTLTVCAVVTGESDAERDARGRLVVSAELLEEDIFRLAAHVAAEVGLDVPWTARVEHG